MNNEANVEREKMKEKSHHVSLCKNLYVIIIDMYQQLDAA